MGKNVYLLITDLHLGNIKAANRIDYRKEQVHIESELLKVALKYKSQGLNVISLFLGDIFHNSYKDVNEALADREFITMWKEKAGESYVCMGNHEFTYYKANPFYSCLSEIASERVMSTGRIVQPNGLINTLQVVDRLDDGEVHFYFNHHGTGVYRPETDGINIGLFHQDLLDRSMESFGEWTSGYLDFDTTGTFGGYNYAFLGHMHMVYGVWKSRGTVLVYLGSLGRTKENEINDNNLERNIPAVIVNDGRFMQIDNNKFNLLSRSECIREGVIVETKVKNEVRDAIKVARNYSPVAERPLDGVKQFFIDNPRRIKIIEESLVNGKDEIFTELERKCRDAGYYTN